MPSTVSSVDTPGASPARDLRRRRWLWIAAIGVLLLILGIWLWRRHEAAVAAAAAARIRERDPRAVVSDGPGASGAAMPAAGTAASGDDAYQAYVVPDDLIW